MPVLDTTGLIDERVGAIRAYHLRSGVERAQVDVSGRLDSAVVLALLAHAVGSGNVTAVHVDVSSGLGSRSHARQIASAIGVRLVEPAVAPLFHQLLKETSRALDEAGYRRAPIRDRMLRDPAVLESIRRSLHASVARSINQLTGGAVRHGTASECDLRFLRSHREIDDGGVDTMPLAMLASGEVAQLAVALDLPRDVVLAAGLPDGHAGGSTNDDATGLFDLTGVHWTTSRVDPDSGRYTAVGTVERMARLADGPGGDDGRSAEALLFGDAPAPLVNLIRPARRLFPGHRDQSIAAFLHSARRVERATRPARGNTPPLGKRETLVQAGILTDELPLDAAAPATPVAHAC